MLRSLEWGDGAEFYRQFESVALLAVEPCDLRKSFNGLHGLATERLGEDPRQGAPLCLASPTAATHAVEDAPAGTARGLWVLSKRLEKGTLFLAEKSGGRTDQAGAGAAEALAMLTDGVDLRGAKLRPWYERE